MKNVGYSSKKGIGESIVGFADLVQSLIFIGTIINSVMAPVLDKFDELKLPQFIIGYVNFFNIHSIQYFVNCAIMVFFIVKLVIVLKFQNKKRNEEIISVIDCLHTNYIHDMRNHIHDLEKLEKRTFDMSNKDDVKNYEDLYNSHYKILGIVAQQCVNQISDIINECMGMPNKGKESICTCIKMVSIYEKDKPISERSLITLARSKNSSRKRMQNVGKHIIGKNTDFLDLSKGYRNFYYGINLKNKFEKREYNNSTPDFSYESTVVVPIRFSDMHSTVNFFPEKKKKSRLEIQIKNDVDIIGYLCIDTEKILQEWENSKQVEKIVKILAFYADSLYVYLSIFQKTFMIDMGGRK